ncbi:retinitis pigmentosa 1-like 1 protein [Kryptolebias marmoratus]|uniref:retinitis pigmentosa 1-like 1 protein n=1 Tax=Kryptolebias marmoratus TaxID=37003 RepID=UPI0007F91176|nr:retinitis pigmentosa 1-like 1 protein [Kryptolebias marmoratus]
MRPTTSTMLQQNNNNNYPCLNKSDSTQEIMQKCSRTSLLFPSRLELGDLPLVRGLRAWALCSRNRRKAGSLLEGGNPPTAPPLGRRSSTSCPRPADVYLSGELGRLGYGLPLGLDARALVTVATLKPSEGSGKTQTRCLFLRTEKGSCLYSTAKPSPGGTTSTAPSMVGEWLKGKTGGGTDSPPAQDGANRVRVRSGRRWRKSGNVPAGQEKRERQQTTEAAVEERQEEQDKGGPDSKTFSGPQQNSSRTRCCHSVSPKTCSPCGRRPQRRESQDEQEGAESPDKTNKLSGEVKGRSRERQEAEPNPDPESDRASSSRDADGDERIEESGTETSPSQDDFTETEDANPDVLRKRTGDNMETQKDFCREAKASEDEEEEDAGQESEKQMESISSAEFAPIEDRVCSSDHEPNFAAEESNTVTEDSNRNRKASVSLNHEEKETTPSVSETERRTVRGQDGSTGTGLDGAEAEEEEEEGGFKDGWSSEPEESWKTEDWEPNTCVFNPVALFSPAPFLPPLASMATGLPSLEVEEEEEKHEAERGDGDERRRRGTELEERGSTVAPEEEEEEEDEFGVFIQAEGEPACSEGVNMSASVPCGSRGRIAVPAGSSLCAPDWTGSSFHQSGDSWAAFPQDPPDSGRDAAEQWWPASAVEATNHSLASVFAEAFPSAPGASSGDSCRFEAVPTLTQLLGGRAGQDQRLLDNFHDLNKMIGRSYKRASRTSRDLLLKTLHLQQPVAESRSASWTTNRHLSPGLPSANQHAHHAAAKRRLSYDYNRNVVE